MDSHSSGEEIDYMSDSFVQHLCGKEDIIPGLIKCHAQHYNHKSALKKKAADEKNRLRNPSIKEREAKSREIGLNVPLNKENVGFKMLQKLGFRPGSGLGKSGDGRVDPIFVEVKTDRQGLGRKTSLEEIALLRAKYMSEAKERSLNIDDYRTRKAGEAAEKRAFLDLMKSQRVCWELDSKECIDEPAEIWFWPECKLPDNNALNDEEDETYTSNEDEYGQKDAAEEEEEHEKDKDFSVQEKLEMLTLYLRKTYLYCVWCGYTFEDEKDLQQDCPGPTKDDH